jgi:cytosine/creatinine deaminase
MSWATTANCGVTETIATTYRGQERFVSQSGAGTVVQFGIPRVVIGEDKSFPGNIDFLKEHGIDVVLLNDPQCESLMQKFIKEKPDLWNEDIAGREHV